MSWCLDLHTTGDSPIDFAQKQRQEGQGGRMLRGLGLPAAATRASCEKCYVCWMRDAF